MIFLFLKIIKKFSKNNRKITKKANEKDLINQRSSDGRIEYQARNSLRERYYQRFSKVAREEWIFMI